MLHRIAADDPDRPAIVGRDAHLTYGELHAESRRISATLESQLMMAATTDHPHLPSVLPPIVAICLSTAVDIARISVAVEAGPRILTVIDERWPTALQMRLIAATGATALITDSPALKTALRASGWRGLVLRLADLAPTTPNAAEPEVPADDAPFLLLTSSGTTGAPKAFLKTRAQYAANIEVSHEYLGADDRVTTFAPGPMSYSLTLYTLFEVLATGGQLHVADSLDELWLTSRVHDERITRLVTIPAAVTALVDAAPAIQGGTTASSSSSREGRHSLHRHEPASPGLSRMPGRSATSAPANSVSSATTAPAAGPSGSTRTSTRASVTTPAPTFPPVSWAASGCARPPARPTTSQG